MSKTATTAAETRRRWAIDDSLDTYGINRWGSGYFSINADGNVTVSGDHGTVDLKALVDDLASRGIQLPIVIRFSDLLRSRIALIGGFDADGAGLSVVDFVSLAVN